MKYSRISCLWFSICILNFQEDIRSDAEHRFKIFVLSEKERGGKEEKEDLEFKLYG